MTDPETMQKLFEAALADNSDVSKPPTRLYTRSAALSADQHHPVAAPSTDPGPLVFLPLEGTTEAALNRTLGGIQQ